MSQKSRTELQEQSQHLMDGPLKHIRGAALAAALVPLASVYAAPASAQTVCQSAGNVCGFVWNDTNNNGLQETGETGIEGAVVSIVVGTDTVTTDTGPDGFYYFFVPDGVYTIGVVVPQGMVTAPSNAGNDTTDSDGVSNGFGSSVATVTVLGNENPNTDFGFVTSAATNPGTGTPGYWKNHPDAWPAVPIIVGGVTYTKAEAIAWLGKVGKDKTTTMFSSLLPAMLNVAIDNDGSCVNAAIKAGNAWMAAYGPVGSNVPASSYAWSVGEPTHQTLDAYNNGLLCAPHRK
jgi:hypothetical protein